MHLASVNLAKLETQFPAFFPCLIPGVGWAQDNIHGSREQR